MRAAVNWQIETAAKVPQRESAVCGDGGEDCLHLNFSGTVGGRSVPDGGIWVVLSEAVLHQEVGGREVMREQLAHLLTMRKRPWVKVQVPPFAAGAHTGLMGSFAHLRFDSDPDIIYTEDFVQGHMTANPDAVRDRPRDGGAVWERTGI